jgi:hypothetical protein
MYDGGVFKQVTGDCNERESKVIAGSSAPAASHAPSHLSHFSILHEHAVAIFSHKETV